MDIRKMDDIVGEVLEISRRSRTGPTKVEVNRYLHGLAALDFGVHLKRHFDRSQVREIVHELQRFLPHLNRQVLSETRVSELRKIASGLGASLDARPFGAEGAPRSLRGFYLSNTPKPLISVNTETHPVATAAAFWHEVGHHLTRRIFDRAEDVALNFGSNYREHLNDPKEVIADTVMALGCYPRPAARRLFGSDAAAALIPDRFAGRVLQYVRSTTRYQFEPTLTGAENLSRLAGMLYVGKLRAALQEEYDL
jgi:hypothetical protein